MKRTGEERRGSVRTGGVRNEDGRMESVMSEGGRWEEGEGATEEKTGAVSGSHTAEPVQIPDYSIEK